MGHDKITIFGLWSGHSYLNADLHCRPLKKHNKVQPSSLVMFLSECFTLCLLWLDHCVVIMYWLSHDLTALWCLVPTQCVVTMYWLGHVDDNCNDCFTLCLCDLTSMWLQCIDWVTTWWQLFGVLFQPYSICWHRCVPPHIFQWPRSSHESGWHVWLWLASLRCQLQVVSSLMSWLLVHHHHVLC